jgi:hypothetical protein
MAAENRLWGAERIRGELRKLGIRVSKRTIQKYMRPARRPERTGQTWATFLHNHAHQIWVCDLLQVSDLWFRSLFAFFIIELNSRKVVHVGVMGDDGKIRPRQPDPRLPADLGGSVPRLWLRRMTHRSRCGTKRMHEVASTVS